MLIFIVQDDFNIMVGGKLLFSVFVVGVSSVIAQVLLLREFVSFAGGNELSYGMLLAVWLLLVALGSFLGGRITFLSLEVSQLLLSFLLPLQLFFVRSANYFFINPGEIVSISRLFFYSLVFLLPSALFGFQFAAAARASRSLSGVYMSESLGSALGGLLFAFLLVYILTPFQAVFLLSFLNLLSFFLLSKSRTVFFIALGVLAFAYSSDLDLLSSSLHFSGQSLVFQENSRYGWLAVTRSGEQLNFYENGAILFSTGDDMVNEEVAHFALAQHPNPKSVLLIGGGASGVLREILKYDVSSVDYVEVDPALISIGERFVPESRLLDGRVSTHESDGILFLKSGGKKYDVIIVNVPNPSTASLNRFYTREFFGLAKRSLNSGGVLSVGVSSSENYLSGQTRLLNSAVFSTLNSVFPNVLVIPGDRAYFIASDRALDYDFLSRLPSGLKYVNENYLKSRISQERIDFFRSALSISEINTDFKPVSYFYNALFFSSMFGSANTLYYSGLVLLLFFFSALFFSRRIPNAVPVFAGGFFGMSSEILLIFSVQALYGYAYSFVGVLVAVFMLGILAGAWLARRSSERMFLQVNFLMAVYPLFLLGVLFFLREFRIAPWLVFSLLVFVPGFVVGAIFPLACSGYKNRAPFFYALDLAGAFFGALLTSVFLVPVFGVVYAILALFLLGVFSMVTIKYF